MTHPVKIKKYANRRLYDTEASRYITLGELAQLIRDGKRVEIVDAKSGDDVTAFILTQVIMEEAKNKNALLPPPLLHLVIRYGDNLLVDFFENYLQQVLSAYLNYRSSVDRQFKEWLDIGTNLADISRQSTGELNPLKPFFDMFFDASTDPNRKEKGNDEE
ncbi:MAG: polyhydroxyalkanoate synthesis regulator DNA-binding domain-containing protein [Desulfobacterales bacterium]